MDSALAQIVYNSTEILRNLKKQKSYAAEYKYIYSNLHCRIKHIKYCMESAEEVEKFEYLRVA